MIGLFELTRLINYFSQLFGESNAEEDVSPDTADPEATAEAGKDALATESNEKVSLEVFFNLNFGRGWVF